MAVVLKTWPVNKKMAHGALDIGPPDLNNTCQILSVNDSALRKKVKLNASHKWPAERQV